MIDFLLDVPNFLVIIIFISLCFIAKLIPAWLAITLSAISLSPFFINDVLFSASYMPDQYRYHSVVQHLRSFDFDHGEYTTIKWTGLIMAFLPLPFVETIKSLGFFNRFATTALIVWLYAYKKIRGWPLLFVLFYPSFILYSSISLRDNLIFVLMILSIIFYIDRKIFISISLLAILYLIKFQNAIFLIVFMALHEFLHKEKFNLTRGFLGALIFLPIAFYFQEEMLEKINMYSISMYIEDGRDPINFIGVSYLTDFLLLGGQGALYFLLKPLPWEARNIFQVLQSIENFLLIFVLLTAYKYAFRVNRVIFFKWASFLFICFSVYGFVVFNYGTAVRYKFPFLLIVVLGIYYELKFKKYSNIGQGRKVFYE
jgi:hypothetical protein